MAVKAGRVPELFQKEIPHIWDLQVFYWPPKIYSCNVIFSWAPSPVVQCHDFEGDITQSQYRDDGHGILKLMMMKMTTQ